MQDVGPGISAHIPALLPVAPDGRVQPDRAGSKYVHVVRFVGSAIRLSGGGSSDGALGACQTYGDMGCCESHIPPSNVAMRATAKRPVSPYRADGTGAAVEHGQAGHTAGQRNGVCDSIGQASTRTANPCRANAFTGPMAHRHALSTSVARHWSSRTVRGIRARPIGRSCKVDAPNLIAVTHSAWLRRSKPDDMQASDRGLPFQVSRPARPARTNAEGGKHERHVAPTGRTPMRRAPK